MPAFAQSKPYSGVTLHGASFQHRFFTLLQKYIPEFEDKTGMKVDLQLSALPVYNQQANLELSSGGSAYDFVNVTFILAARWVAAGLLANLDEFTGDPNLTPAEWNPKDFVDGAQVPYRDVKAGKTFGYSWEGGAMVMGVSRMDLMEKKGLKIPKTFAELQQVCAEINGTDGVNGIVSFQLHHWNLPPYIQGFGGNIFKNPPGDIMPALNTPQAIEAVEFYANLLKNGPTGVLTYTEDQARQSLLTGRSNIFIHSSSWVTPILLSEESKVKDTSRVVRMPAGPVADHPASNSQGLGIPKNAKNKKAAWEFIKWALSPEISMRLVKEHGHSSICRRSVIQSEEYKKLNIVNGQDLGALYLDVLELPAKGDNYMAYRTVKEFPVVGDVLNKAVEQVVSGQLPAPRDRMNAAQDQAIASLRRAGAKALTTTEEGLLDAERRRFNRLALAPSLIVSAAGRRRCRRSICWWSASRRGQLVNPGSAERLLRAAAQLSIAGRRSPFRRLAVGAGASCRSTRWRCRCCSARASRCWCIRGSRASSKSLRIFFLIPMVLPPIVVAVIWKLIYTPDISPIYQAARVLGVALPAMTTHVDFALFSIVLADTWEWAPFSFLMVLAALQNLPAEYVEAARMDGADALRVFGHIVLPYIAPVLLVCTLFRLIDSIKAFPLIFLLTGGGPGSVTEVTNYYAYLVAFNFGELGYSSAITVVLLTATVIISWAAMHVSQRKEVPRVTQDVPSAGAGQHWRRWAVPLILFVMLLPFLWLLQMSFKPKELMLAFPPQLLFTPTLEHYVSLWGDGFPESFVNSLVTSVVVDGAGCAAVRHSSPPMRWSRNGPGSGQASGWALAFC